MTLALLILPPKLNSPSPSKTEQNTKPEGMLVCEQTASLIYRLSLGSTAGKRERMFLCCVLFLLPNSIVRSATPCHRRTR